MDNLVTKSILDTNFFIRSKTNSIVGEYNKNLQIPLFNKNMYNEGIDSAECMVIGLLMAFKEPNLIATLKLNKDLAKFAGYYKNITLIGSPGFETDLTLFDNIEIIYSKFVTNYSVILITGNDHIGYLVEDTNHIGAAITKQDRVHTYDYITRSENGS